MSQTFRVPSSDTDTSLCPLGLTATAVTFALWPDRETPSWPLAMSHTRTFAFAEPANTCLPSGVIAITIDHGGRSTANSLIFFPDSIFQTTNFIHDNITARRE